MSNQDVTLTFSEKEEEVSVFRLEDLVKEYNYKVMTGTSSVFQRKKYPLSLSPLKESSSIPTIRPMTEKEIDSMRRNASKENDRRLLINILEDQMSPQGLVSNTPTIVQGVSLVELIQEIGLTGKVYYKTVEDTTYVILKGVARERPNLKGTRYLNENPQIMRFGLAKVGVTTVFKAGFKTSVYVYGGIKAAEAIEMLLEDGKLKTSFFSEVITDVPKMAMTSAVTAAAAGVVAAAGVPVAIGVGIVLVVGFTAGIAVEFVDQKTGITEKFNEATDKIWENLKEHLNKQSKNQQHVSSWDSFHGLVFGGRFDRKHILKKGNYLVYTA